MANEGTTVDVKVTDSVTQANVSIVAVAPAMAMGSLYNNLSFYSALAAENAVTAQYYGNMAFQASSILGVEKLLGGSIGT